jgi:hypothetical protein
MGAPDREGEIGNSSQNTICGFVYKFLSSRYSNAQKYQRSWKYLELIKCCFVLINLKYLVKF